MNILGQRVKELRLKQGFTQQELADKLSTSNMNIANIESGRVKNPRNLSELAEILKSSPNYLLGGESDILKLDAEIHLLATDNEVKNDFEKDFYVVSIDKDEKLFLTDNAKIVARVKKSFTESK
jgi:transcriptional regulator with XRE-family HTH domain